MQCKMHAWSPVVTAGSINWVVTDTRLLAPWLATPDVRVTSVNAIIPGRATSPGFQILPLPPAWTLDQVWRTILTVAWLLLPLILFFFAFCFSFGTFWEWGMGKRGAAPAGCPQASVQQGPVWNRDQMEPFAKEGPRVNARHGMGALILAHSCMPRPPRGKQWRPCLVVKNFTK